MTEPVPAASPTDADLGLDAALAAVSAASSVPDHLVNLRDVATAAPGLRPGALLRSDAPRSGDRAPEGVAWPPRTVLDLRDPGENGEAHPLSSVARVVPLPVLNGTAVAASGGPVVVPALGDLYVSMLDEPGAGHLVEAVRLIATGDEPVLVHCTAGKDRTGVTVALVLALLDVDREAIVADYERTGPHMRDVMVRAAVTANLAVPDAHLLAKLPPELVTAPGWAIEAVLDRLAEHDGGAQGWFLAHGGDAATLDALRARLVV
ncbi:tyrosine-protein phosphatase [Isoptericola sp. NPDC057653]|uniref:tyrosine-protein phosphatase n=1 Tax=Isoptericola sp. NPDC057653 TaxID=3346195 RepID=UPI0036BE011D